MKKLNKIGWEEVVIIGGIAFFTLRITDMLTRPRVINNYYIHK